jgi:hypothetical protein
MARSINNPVMQGASGRVGKITFRRTVFGSVIANLPDYEMKKEPNEVQLALNKRFSAGTKYIKKKMEEDLLFKEKYASITKPGRSVHSTALADYMSPPKINNIDVAFYTGQVGDTIIIDATDNFGVETVLVTIYNPAGELMESGQATFADPDPDWVYTLNTRT